MKVVIQRVSEASVSVEQKIVGEIKQGLLMLVGFSEEETEEDMQWIAKKIVQLRIFNDENHVMNLSVQDIDGEVLLVSQFTLLASTKKGNRPSYIHATKPEQANEYYQKFISIVEKNLHKSIKVGIFGADMKVHLLNDGPVTIIIDSKNKE